MKNQQKKVQLSDLATKQDVKMLKNDIKDLKDSDSLQNFQINSLVHTFKEFRKEFDDFKEEVIKNLDWLVGAFKKFDEEHTILTQRNIETTDRLDNHETRITVLEKNQSSN